MQKTTPFNEANSPKYVATLQDAIARKKDNDELRIVRLKELMRRLGLSRSSVYTLIKSGQLNAPISLSARAVGWLESDITAFIESRIKASRSSMNGVGA